MTGGTLNSLAQYFFLMAITVVKVVEAVMALIVVGVPPVVTVKLAQEEKRVTVMRYLEIATIDFLRWWTQ